MLATAPQNPDGAELVWAALRGGVLHPPGYPLQAWLDRVWIELPWGSPTFRLSFFSLLSMIAATNGILYVIRRLGGDWSNALIGATLFWFYPTTWYLAVQPEKYGLLSALLAALLALGFAADTPRARRRVVWMGVVFGAACAQHALSILLLPILWARPSVRRYVIAFATTTIAVLAVLYLSLFWLSSSDAWPDWGKLQNLGDLFRLALRMDFSNFQVAGDPSLAAAPNVALPIFLHNYWDAFGVCAALPLLGLFGLFRHRHERRLALGIAVTVAAQIAFLAFARLSPASLPAVAYLERYCLPLVLLFGVLAGLATIPWFAKLPVAWRPIRYVLVLGLAIPLFFAGRPLADAGSDRTVELFQKGLTASEDPAAIYFAGTDLEFFAGYPAALGQRFPVSGEYDWFLKRVLPTLEPRLKKFDLSRLRRSTDLMQSVYSRGFGVMVSLPNLVQGAPPPVIQRGLFSVVRPKLAPGWSADPSQEIWLGMQRLCSVVSELRSPRHTEGFNYPRYLYSAFPLAYRTAAQSLRKLAHPEAADRCAQIADSLEEGRYPEKWLTACAAITSVNL